MNQPVKLAQSIVGTNNDGSRPKDDFYPTPPGATLALLQAESFDREVWEPACGDGAISKTLISQGYTVHSTDLFNHGYGQPGLNFFSFQEPIADTIITNPPFTLAEEWIRHAQGLGITKMALLLKLAFLEGQKRSRLLKRSPLAKVLVFSNRLIMTRNGEEPRGGGMIAFAWFIWDSSHSGPPVIDWIEEVKASNSSQLSF